MSNARINSPISIAISGMQAQSSRMQVIANNIANANTTRTNSGEAYRRMQVVLSTSEGLSGVQMVRAEPDMRTGFTRIRQPGHPDADANGYVNMPNVQLPVEMIDLVTATRAYQAGAAVLKKYQEVMDVATELLK